MIIQVVHARKRWEIAAIFYIAMIRSGKPLTGWVPSYCICRPDIQHSAPEGVAKPDRECGMAHFW